jgi:hypothetical protein
LFGVRVTRVHDQQVRGGVSSPSLQSVDFQAAVQTGSRLLLHDQGATAEQPGIPAKNQSL